MDKSLGDIMTNIKKNEIEENTIIIFMSDNGQPSNTDRNLPLRGHKLTPYEGGIRVPMIVNWPGTTEPESESDNYLIIEDIFPSILEMAGIVDYEQIGGIIDGLSFVPFLEGQYETNQERAIFWHYPNTYDQPPYSTVRKGDWKMIYHHADRKLELFNIAKDISEKNDLADENTEKLNEMVDVLSAFLRETNARMPIDKSTNKPIPYPDGNW